MRVSHCRKGGPLKRRRLEVDIDTYIHYVALFFFCFFFVLEVLPCPLPFWLVYVQYIVNFIFLALSNYIDLCGESDSDMTPTTPPVSPITPQKPLGVV